MNLFPQKVNDSTALGFLSRTDKENTKKMRRVQIFCRFKEKSKCMYFKYCYIYFIKLQKIKCHFSVCDDMHMCALNSKRWCMALTLGGFYLFIHFITLYLLSNLYDIKNGKWKEMEKLNILLFFSQLSQRFVIILTLKATPGSATWCPVAWSFRAPQSSTIISSQLQQPTPLPWGLSDIYYCWQQRKFQPQLLD